MPVTRFPFLYPALFSASRGSPVTAKLFLRSFAVAAPRLGPPATTTPPPPPPTTSSSPQTSAAKDRVPHSHSVTLTRHGTAVPRDLNPLDEKSNPQSQPQPAEGTISKQGADSSQSQTAQGNDSAQKETPSYVEAQSQLLNEFSVPSKTSDRGTTSKTSETTLKDDSTTKTPIGQVKTQSTVISSEKPKGQQDGQQQQQQEAEEQLEQHEQQQQERPLRYYHNFDTYSMAKQMEESGFKHTQATALIKTIRSILIHNIGTAKDEHLSKSMAENENYLFRAACSELRTEVQNSRRAALDKMRIERAELQHDFDQLQQSFSEDLMNLKDEVSSLFNDRKMVSRAEMRAMEVKIQELNYKLTVLLNGDLRSEIESLRWVTTRRSLIALLALVFIIVGFIRTTGVGSSQSSSNTKDSEKEHTDQDPIHHYFTGEGGHTESIVAQDASSDEKKKSNPKDNGDEGTFVSLG